MIEPITEAEFQAVSHKGGRANLSPEAAAVAALEPGKGVKFPCRWKHYGKTGVCGGTGLASQAARRCHLKIRSRCYEGVLYILRPSEDRG